MVLLEQISALLDFLESQPELALAQCNRSIEGRSVAKRRWVECAQILNSVSANCPKKSPTEWRSFYNEFKSKLMRKIKLQKSEMSVTGGDPAKKLSLTPLQKRLYCILGLQPPVSPDLHPSQARPRLTKVTKCLRRPAQYAKERDHVALEASQAKLEQIEARNAEATLAQAQGLEHLAAAIDRLGTSTNQAANRLAAAIEKIGEMFSLFVDPP